MEHLDLAPYISLDLVFEELIDLEQEPELPFCPLSEPAKLLSGPELTKEIHELLMLFTTKKGRPLKKEYVRVSIIRRHKKEIRKALAHLKKPNRKHAIINSAMSEWEKFISHLKANAFILEEASLTEAGPKTEAKTKRKNKLIENEKSHNNKFCVRYFSCGPIKESFYYLIEYLFADLDSENLCKRLKMRCCQSDSHFEKCIEQWLKLKNFFQFWMISDANVAGFHFWAIQNFYELDEIDNVDEFFNQE